MSKRSGELGDRAASPGPMAAETDADLLTLMSWSGEDQASAQTAFVEFYQRHAPFLFAACGRKFGESLPYHYEVDDLVADTFTRVMEKAGTFDASGERDATALRRLTRAWLFTIAKNVLQDVYRGRPTVEQTVSGDVLDEGPAPLPAEDSAAVRLVQDAMDAVLDERERDVLRETFLWYKPGSPYQRLPNDVAADLAKRWETSAENLRKIRASALKKLKPFLVDAGIDKLLG